MPEGQSGFEAKLDPEVRRAILDLRRQIEELRAIVADHEDRIDVLEP